MFLSAAILLLAVGATVLGLDTPDDCAVRAYVRAADLRQNEVSHGELRVKLVGLACAPPARVGLRLTLDEYAQYAPLPDLEENGFERTVMRHGLENFTEAATASLQERGFSTSVTWKVHDQQLNSREGFIKPFSVVMPNVQYPTSVLPLKFTCGSKDDKSAFRFGRAYRYVAWVLFEDGRYLSAPAGYTSFAISPAHLDRGTAEQVEIVQQVPRERYLNDWRNAHGVGSAKCCRKDEFPSTIPVQLTFPQGNLVVPGERLQVHVELLEPEPTDSETSIGMHLSHHPHVSEGSSLLIGAQCTNGYILSTLVSSSSANSDEIDHRFFDSKIVNGAPTIATLSIDSNSPIDAPGAFFTSKAWVDLHVTRRHRVSTSFPGLWHLATDRLIPKGYVHEGQSPISGRWAYDAHGVIGSQQSYKHRIELPLAKPKPIGTAYHEALGSTEQPIMASGHVQTRQEAEQAGARFEDKLPERTDIALDLDLFLGQYVGLLWLAREQSLATTHAASSLNTGAPIVGEQVVFN